MINISRLFRNQNRPPSRPNGILKPVSTFSYTSMKSITTVPQSSPANDYFIVDLQRPSIDSSFGFSIRGGREFSIPLYILKVAENGAAAHDGQMKVIPFDISFLLSLPFLISLEIK